MTFSLPVSQELDQPTSRMPHVFIPVNLIHVNMLSSESAAEFLGGFWNLIGVELTE